MADWNLPSTIATNYPDFLTYLKNRDIDAATLFLSTPTNPQEGFIRYVRATALFEEYLSGVWTARILSLAGGGTGAANAAGARSNLGLGGMAVQNPGNVAITGGTIAGISFDAAVITNGNFDIARLPTGGTWNLTTLLALAGHALHVKSLGANYRVGAGTTLTDTDFLYECSGGTITLPDCTTLAGRLYIVKRSGSTITLDPFGAQVISINGVDTASYTGLAANQSIILQSSGTKWIAITIGGTVYRPVQHFEATMNTDTRVENQVLPTPVLDVTKAMFTCNTGMIRNNSSSPFALVDKTNAYFSDSAGNKVTSGGATHLRLTNDNSLATGFLAQTYHFTVIEWE